MAFRSRSRWMVSFERFLSYCISCHPSAVCPPRPPCGLQRFDKWAVSLQDGEGKGHGGTPTHTPKEADSFPMPRVCKSIQLEQFPADNHVCLGLPEGVCFCKLLPSGVWVIYQGLAAETWLFWVRLKEVVGGGNELWSGRLETEMFHGGFFFFF